MPLSFEQFKQLRGQGLNIDQINKFESGYIPKKSIETLRSEAETAEKGTSKSVFGRTLREIPKETYKTIAGSAPQFLTSAAAAPIDIARGFMGKEPMKGEAKFPGLDPFKTIQAETSERIDKGESPVVSAGIGAFKTGLGALETTGLFKGLRATPGLVEKGIPIFKKGVSSISEKLDARKMDKIIDMVSPKNTLVKGTKQIEKGKGVAPSVFGRAKIDYSEIPYIQKAANAVKDVVKTGKSFTENINRVRNKIKDISVNTIKPFLSKNPAYFNFEDLINSFKLVRPSSSLKSDARAMETYKRVGEELQTEIYNHLKKYSGKTNPVDFNELWNANKIIDRKIKQELGDAVLNNSQLRGVNAAARDYRKQYSDFIKKSLAHPGSLQMEKVNKMEEFMQVFTDRGGEIPNEKAAYDILEKQFGIDKSEQGLANSAYFRSQIDKLNSMYDAVHNMAPKAYKEMGKTKFELLEEKYPKIKKSVKYGIPLLVGEEIGRRNLF